MNKIKVFINMKPSIRTRILAFEIKLSKYEKVEDYEKCAVIKKQYDNFIEESKKQYGEEYTINIYSEIKSILNSMYDEN